MILDLHSSYAIVLSAGVAITYTLLGGLYSVAYTDVIQLVIIFISLVRAEQSDTSLICAESIWFFQAIGWHSLMGREPGREGEVLVSFPVVVS